MSSVFSLKKPLSAKRFIKLNSVALHLAKSLCQSFSITQGTTYLNTSPNTVGFSLKPKSCQQPNSSSTWTLMLLQPNKNEYHIAQRNSRELLAAGRSFSALRSSRLSTAYLNSARFEKSVCCCGSPERCSGHVERRYGVASIEFSIVGESSGGQS